ncbi:glycosyltransferase family 4 protein [uncultured Prochlorococcus sp.]|uniref:glycosyltransferase family 4 protein n=1 Tax=uncultured Prochlorococcus sp. TaxID=159733 RepID=UPI00258ADAC2|nr:glycosyltransferase family 4 protein [uncultured Prochlorococcus sp.]
MKVVYLHQYFSTNSGSGGIRSFEFAKALIRNGHHVHVICLYINSKATGLKGPFINGKRHGYFEEIEITEFKINYSNYQNLFQRSLVFLRYLIRASKACLTLKYDLTFATSTPLTILIPALLSKLFKGTPYIFEVRDLWPELPIKMGLIKNRILIWLLTLLENIGYRYASHCIGLAPGICNEINSRGIPKETISFIPNFSNLNIFYPSIKKECKSKYIEKYFKDKISKKDFILAFTGAHGLANGLENIIEVANYLRLKNQKNIKFIFIGDGAQKPYLISLVKKRNLKNCHFFDPISRNDLAIVLREVVDVGLMCLQRNPSFFYGTSPNKFFDYLASGLPIIINYPGWLTDLILKEKNGVFCDSNNVEYFGDSIIKLSKDSSSLKLYANNSRKIAENKYSKELMTRKLIDIFKLAIQNKTLKN